MHPRLHNRMATFWYADTQTQLWRWLIEGWPSINALRDRLPIPALSPGQEGTDAARTHTAEPSTLPLSHPVGDSYSANEPGDATLPFHVGRTARNSISVVAGSKVTDDLLGASEYGSEQCMFGLRLGYSVFVQHHGLMRAVVKLIKKLLISSSSDINELYSPP
ncbi:hypothetical protein FQN60_010121 [Etheostoma spectabile]|uniref:Uncharacterized protein n=1 Tax=Etheostoma spectabile TaxID=54343 RepID=A0A5J5D821_9PERO|nr:hypothetical protein FQN60_010121 [Etheostoma spectabile]